MDLAENVPSSIQLHGYDISEKQFPPRCLWPKNLTLSLLDSLQVQQPIQTDGYDVIHLRMWASNLRATDVNILIRNVKRMLSKFPVLP